jgi:hypothetical protein
MYPFMLQLRKTRFLYSSTQLCEFSHRETDSRTLHDQGCVDSIRRARVLILLVGRKVIQKGKIPNQGDYQLPSLCFS